MTQRSRGQDTQEMVALDESRRISLKDVKKNVVADVSVAHRRAAS
jgi:hypothetical protein